MIVTVFKCPKCSYKTDNFRVMQKHYKDNHGSRSKTKGNQKKVYVYKPGKGRKGFGRRR